MFDAVVPPGGKEAFYVKPKHRVLGEDKDRLVRDDIDAAFDFGGPEEGFGDEKRGYDKATVQPTWLIGVTGAEPEGDPKNATARIVGTNFEEWTDDPKNNRWWAQSPNPGISGPGMWTGTNLIKAIRRHIEAIQEEGLQGLDPTPPPTTTGEHTYDASGTVLAGAHIDTYNWGFKQISDESWNEAQKSALPVDPVALAYLYESVGTEVGRITTPAHLQSLLTEVLDGSVADDLSALSRGLRKALDAIEYDITKQTKEPLTTVELNEEALWGVTLIVEDENEKRGITNDLINVERHPPNIESIENPSAPIEINNPEEFVAKGVSSPKDGISADDMKSYDWVVNPVDVPSVEGETGRKPLTELATVVSENEERAKIEFKVPGEYVVKVFVTDPDGETGVEQRQVFLVEREQESGSGFVDDFDYPGDELDDHGWTTITGEFTTENSYLVTTTDSRANKRIRHNQPHAAGTFEFSGVQNTAQFFGLGIQFIGLDEQLGRGYRLQVIQHRGNERNSNFQDIQLKRDDHDGSEVLLKLTEDHDGELHDIRVERDSDTHEFTCYLDGEKVGSVVDDTYTESNYMIMKYDAGSLDHRIDRVGIEPPPTPSPTQTPAEKEAGVIENFENGLSSYKGATDLFKITQSVVFDGEKALKSPDVGPTEGSTAIINPDIKITPGDTIAWMVQHGNEKSDISLGFLRDPADPKGYRFGHSNTSRIGIARVDGGGNATGLASQRVGAPTGQWYELVTSWAADGTLTFEVRRDGSTIGKVSTRDTTYDHGFLAIRESSPHYPQYIDYIRRI